MKHISFRFAICVSALLATTSFGAHAQSASASSATSAFPATSQAYQREPFQITLVSPLGMNGLHAGRTVNTVSLNLLAGYAAGVKGVELGGLLNVDLDSVQGLQAAGLGNLVGGPAQGAQLAGLTNITVGSVQGAQVAGLLNYQGSAPHVAATTQVAGLANVTPGKIQGVQVAGLLNVARTVKGLQLAPVNIADSVAGASIGILSLVRHGYHRAEVWTSEALTTNAAYKMGASHQFYNIIAVGAQPFGDKFRWGLGYGFGTEIAPTNRLTLSVDVLSFQVNEKKGWTKQLNLLNQLRPMLGWRLSPTGRTTLLVGPTLNVMVSTYRTSESSPYGSRLGGRHLELFNETHGRTNTRAWLGLNAGLRF
ncbi:hypothetical protein [Hymenobacter volaticus]|uniref:DUF5723 domain-containing protein n=1 Tax=Hymenobacter volaticus TaxID=2932254 RepID=A0ABY4GD87_9BACT|nr:hypothetical protein [Hymenobacter volaticus]UOQ68837.1 hypothetical protein MUN86_25560 [Hymenobacter volaticus]